MDAPFEIQGEAQQAFGAFVARDAGPEQEPDGLPQGTAHCFEEEDAQFIYD